jgi:hypothetical protein
LHDDIFAQNNNEWFDPVRKPISIGRSVYRCGAMKKKGKKGDHCKLAVK